MGSFAKIVPFVSEPPRIEISGGIATIQIRSGRDVTELVTTVCNLARSIERGQRALNCHAAGDDHIIIDD